MEDDEKIDQSIRELMQIQNAYNTTVRDIQRLIKEIGQLQEENEALQIQEDWGKSVSWTPLEKTLHIVKQIEAHPELKAEILENLSEKLLSLRLELTNLRSEEQ